jgi:hypothetical protein
MKKFGLIVLLVVAMVASFSCVSSKAEKEPEAPKQGLPDFVMNPPTATDAIYGVGYAKMSSFANSLKFAEANARTDIANQIKVTVQAAITQYSQEAGVDDNNQVINFAESVSRQITDTVLSGATPKRREQDADGGVWVLMEYPLNKFKEAATETFARNEDAAFAEFKAAKALEALDYQLANNPSKSEPVK